MAHRLRVVGDTVLWLEKKRKKQGNKVKRKVVWKLPADMVVTKAQTPESLDRLKTIISGLRRAGPWKYPRSQPESSQYWGA